MSDVIIPENQKKIDDLIEEYKSYFINSVSEGKEILNQKKDILLPIFTDLAEGQLSLLSPNASDNLYGKKMVESANRSLEDQIGALKAELGNVILDGVVNGLRAVFTKFLIPVLLKTLVF